MASDLGLQCLQKPICPNTYLGLLRYTSINPMRSPRNIFFIPFSEMIYFINTFDVNMTKVGWTDGWIFYLEILNPKGAYSV